MGSLICTVNEEEIVIEYKISLYHIRVIDIKMTPAQQAEYVKIHTFLIHKLCKTLSEQVSKKNAHEIGGRFDMKIYRQLRHTSFSLALEHLAVATSATKKRNLVNDIAF